MYGGLPMTVVPCAAISRNRDVEVGHLQHVVLGDQDVGRPQVAVDHALPVGMIDGVADLAGEVERPVDVERAVRGDQVLERLTLHMSMTMKNRLSCFSAVVMATMFGWLTLASRPRLAKQLAEVEP